MTTQAISALRVAIVDDDADIRELVSRYLQMNGVEVCEAVSEAELVSALSRADIHVVLLDINLGREDGFAIARRLRARNDWRGGIVMLTGRVEVVDRVVGLEMGADDYVAKPFELRELLARIRSVARRVMERGAEPASTHPATNTVYTFSEFVLDVEARTLHRMNSQQAIALTTGEFELLLVLVQNARRVLSRDQVLRATHGRDAGPFDRTVDVQIGRLRKKLGDTDQVPQLIKSVRGAGYLLAVASSKSCQ